MKNKFIKSHSLIVFLILIICSTALAFGLFTIVPDASANIALIYIVALVMTARFTKGYWYGIVFALYSVISVNFLFTYPYFKLDFTLTGYPLTFVIMLIITLSTSATTTHSKIQACQLAERDEMLMKADKEKMRANLLRAISHDIRTPLTSIIGETNSYFELDETRDKKDARIHRINDDANWLLHMVENLLSITRIQDSEITKVKKSSELLEEIISESVYRFKKREPNALLDVIIPEDYIMLPMDPLLIEQVIINLLDNAYVHSNSDQGIQLTVTDNDAYISVHIRDYGKGIKPELIPTIFDGNGTRNTTIADTKRGMGIGLSICKTIIEAHNGTINVTNHDNGAEFTFSIPKEATDVR